MAFAPIAFVIPEYDRNLYKNWWLKAYVPATTTPKTMATDSTGATTASRLELNSQGFPITAGNAFVVPYIDGDYDLWLFPTAAEADDNDTTNALQFADNLGIEGTILSVLNSTGSTVTRIEFTTDILTDTTSPDVYESDYASNAVSGGGGKYISDGTTGPAGTVTETHIYNASGDGYVSRDLLLFDNVSDMNSVIKLAGQKAKTTEYLDATLLGGASYNIVQSSEFTGTPDEIGDHTSSNGTVAVLEIDDDINLDQFGVVGSADDTAELKAALLRVGNILFNSSKSYTSLDELKLIDGTQVDLNGSTITFECVGNIPNFVMGSNTRLHNGIIIADNDPNGVSSTIGCRPVRVAGKSVNPDGSDPELIENWIIENLTIFPGVVFGSGEIRGGRAIVIRDNVENGIVRNIKVDGRGMTSGTVYAEWGEHEFFPDPTVDTVHPRNVLIENVTLRNAGQTGSTDIPSMGCSGCYNFTFRDCDLDGANISYIASMGEPGLGYASDSDKLRILRGITFENCIATDTNQGVQLFGRGNPVHPLADTGIPHGDITFTNCHFYGRLGQVNEVADRDGAFMNSFGRATFEGCTIRNFSRYGYYPVFGNGYLRILGGEVSFNNDVGIYMIGDSSTDGDTNLYGRGEIRGVKIEGNCIDNTIVNPCGIQTFYTRFLTIDSCEFFHGGTQDICVNAGSSVFARYIYITQNSAFDPAITRIWKTSRANSGANNPVYRILVHDNMFDSATASIEGTFVTTTDGL